MVSAISKSELKMAQEIKTMPVGVLKKLRRMEMEIREILDFFDLNRTYYVSGDQASIKTLAKVLKQRDLPFTLIEERGQKHISFEPEVYTQITDTINAGVEKGKIKPLHVHQTSEMIYVEEVEKEEQPVFVEMFEFLQQFKAGKGYKEESESYKEELEEMVEEHNLTKKVKKVRQLLANYAECLVIPKDKMDDFAKHCGACEIEL